MWVSFVVPVAVLLATLLLQRLETRLLSTSEPGARPPHPRGPRPLQAIGPREPRETQAPPRSARASAA